MNPIHHNIQRRSFIKISAAAGGGLILGFNLSSCTSSEEIKVMPEEWFDMNAFLKIGDNGVVTIYSQNPEIGQNVKTSMPMIIADELDVDWNDVIVEQAPLDSDKYSRQVAGGSQSIRHRWTALRTAGATAKAMLIAAAAQRWEIKPEDCSVDKGVIKNSKGDKLTFGDVASEAAQLEVPSDVKLKKPSEFTIIGTDRRNVDMEGILAGRPLFGIDTKKEGMAYVSVLRPPAFGLKLKSYDDSAAKVVNGVEEVLQFGDKVAVLASSNWVAMKGKKAIKAEWEEETKAENTSYHDEKMLDLLTKNAKKPVRKDGNVEKAFKEADEVVERIYEAPFLPHNCLEPMNFYADVTDDRAYFLGPIQTPQWTRSRIAQLLDREENEVHIEMSRMGGGFGRRLYGDFALEAAEISHLAKKPIQLLFSREDDMTAGTYRPATKYKIQAGIKDGRITSYKLTEVAINSNMYNLIPNFFPAGAIANYQVDNHKIDSNITTGAWRAPYTNFLAFAEQSFLDEVAEILEIDPVQLRLDLLEEAKKNQDDERMQWSPDRMQGVIRLAAEKSNWGHSEAGIFQGFSAYYSHNTHVAEVAEVVMENGTPRVKRVVCVVDCGIVINPMAAKNQIEGGVVDGIGHAMYGDLTFEKGKPQSDNFDKFRLIRHGEAPEVEVFFVENEIDPTGLGEPSLPPAGGALSNAIYKATGKRLYKQPFVNEEALLG